MFWLLVDSNDRSEEPRVSRHQVGEDEFESGVVALGQDVERLCHPAELGVDRLGRDVEDAVVADC